MNFEIEKIKIAKVETEDKMLFNIFGLSDGKPFVIEDKEILTDYLDDETLLELSNEMLTTKEIMDFNNELKALWEKEDLTGIKVVLKEKMTARDFADKLKAIMDTFYSEIHKPMVELLNEYKKDNADSNYYSISGYEGVNRIEDMALLTAWMLDKLDNKQDCFAGGRDYRGSKTKAIRKALGYTI